MHKHVIWLILVGKATNRSLLVGLPYLLAPKPNFHFAAQRLQADIVC